MNSANKKGERTRIIAADSFRRSLKLALGVCALTWGCGGSHLYAASAPGASPSRFEAKVVDISADSRSVSVPLHSSVIVRTTVEIARADVVATDVATVQPVSPTELLLTGNTYGRTNVVLWGKKNEQYVLRVRVELNLAELTEMLKRIDPQSNVQAKSVFGNIVLTGTVSSAARAKRMTELANLFLPPAVSEDRTPAVQNHLEVAGEQQVLLRCVVAEVSRRAIRDLGVNGFLAGENVRDAFLVNQIGQFNPINIGAAGNVAANGKIPFLTDAGGIPISDQSTLSLGFPRVQTQFFIKAMAENSLASILAEPNLVAISGETASFLAGGEFPIPVPQGNQQVTIQFREFGIRLNFTPTVKAHQQIRLRVAPEVSELDFTTSVRIEGFVVPGLKSRSAETTIEMASGQTIAMAGLLSEDVRGLATRIPGIGDVPILGALFRSVNYQRSLTELVILVTPEIVAPLDPQQVPHLPTDDIHSPSDFNLYMLGLLESPRSAEETTADQTGAEAMLDSEPDKLHLHGPWGYSSPLVSR